MSETPVPPRGLGARLARNSLHQASGRVVAIVAWLVLTPLLVRGLGPEGFGVWSLFYALTGWLGSLDLGFSQVALRFGASARERQDGQQAGEYATLAVLGYVALGAVWLVVVLLATDTALDLLRISGPARVQASLAFAAGAFVFVLSGLTNTTTAALQAWDRFDLANGVTLTASLAQVAGLALALTRPAPLAACLVAVACGWLAALAVGLVLLARGVPAFRWASPRAALARRREAMRFGVPLQFANGLAVAHQQLGKLLLVRVVSLVSIVPYELGLRVATTSQTFAQLVLVAMIPEASVLHERADSARLLALHRRAGRFVTGAGAVFTAALLASAPALFTVWLGHRDDAAALALRGLALAAYAAMAGGISGAIARGVGRTTLEMEWSGLALTLHAIGGVLLIPRYGLEGALIAIIAANVVSAMWFAFRLGRAQAWPVGRLMLEPFAMPVLAMAAGVLAGWATGISIAAAWPALVLSAAAAGATTFVLLLLTRHLEWRELASLARRGAAA